MNYTVKPIEHYIEKHGVEKGTIIWKTEKKKAEKYNSQPYKRLTKEWFLWRYGENEGKTKFEKHVNKSKQSLENFIRRYGEEKGRLKYQECMAKKNTGSLESVLKVKPNITISEAKNIIKDRYTKVAISNSKRRSTFSDEKKAAICDKSKKTKAERYNGAISSINILRYKYSEDSKEVKDYKRKLFPTVPGQASKPCLDIILKILNNLQYSNSLTIYYGDLKNGKSEYKIWSEVYERGFMYDFVVCKNDTPILVMEYDGAAFHPTLEEAATEPNKKMASGKSARYQYNIDNIKKSIVYKLNAKLFIIRSDDNEEIVQYQINQIRSIIENA